jgi:lipase chaperone LimK
MIVHKSTYLIGVIVIVIALGVLFYLNVSKTNKVIDVTKSHSIERFTQESDSQDEQAFTLNTENVKSENETLITLQGSEYEEENTLFFDDAKVRDVIGRLNVDEDENLVIDSYAKRVLKRSFIELMERNDPMAIDQLLAVIRSELPGLAGEQAANIVLSYYEYRMAESELIEQNLNLIDTGSTFNYEDLVNMRRAYLGEDIAEKLFAEEEIRTRYTLAVIDLDRDPGLSSEQKLAQQKILESDMHDQLNSLSESDPVTSIQNGSNQPDKQVSRFSDSTLVEGSAQQTEDDIAWREKFMNYWEERENIIMAGLSENDKELQIKELREHYFSEQEMERVDANELRLKIEQSQSEGE